MKSVAIALLIVSGSAVAQSYGPPNNNTANSNVYNENPTLPPQAVQQQPSYYFGPEVFPNYNPGNPGMVDDSDKIFEENKK